jgi:hypothetical protein
MSDGDAARAKREDEAATKRKRESVLSYWGAVVKDDRKLCKFDLGSLERKMFSWSVQDIFNRDLLRQQVAYHSCLLSSISPCLLHCSYEHSSSYSVTTMARVFPSLGLD